MSCSCGGCVSRDTICIPRGDDMSVIVSVYDSSGDEFDISSADEIIFIVADGVGTSGNIGPGGTIRVTKRLSTGGITIAGTLYQFVVAITGTDTEGFTRTNNYWEAMVETSSGVRKTVAAGKFKSENTMIRDLP